MLNKINNDERIIGFVHIEKSAGTTLNHILRKNYFPNHLDVRPLYPSSTGMFHGVDLKASLKINPCLKSISGHSLVPYIDLGMNLDYITILRDPVRRYLSRYQYLVDRRGYKLSYGKFANNQETHNFQVKKIAGSADVKLAIKLLEKKFSLVGILEEFDLFLVMLEMLLKDSNFDASYKIENSSSNISKSRKLIEKNYDEYKDIAYENNILDIELYNYVLNEILPKQKSVFGGDRVLHRLKEDLRKRCVNYKRTKRMYLDYFLRHYYYNVVIGMLRRKNNIPYFGSYGNAN